MVSMASKAEHLAGSPPTLATVRSKDNFFFFKGKLILIIGEEKKFLLTLVVSLAGPCKLDWKRYINKKKQTNRNLLTCSVHTCETKVMTTDLKGWLELWLV